MPELPEVETVRRSLVPYLPGRTIMSVEVRDAKVLLTPIQSLVGQTFRDPERIGKQLILPLTDQTLLVHLGMTGQLTFRDPNREDQPFSVQPVTGLQRSLQHPVDKHTHISLHLDDGTAVHYRDIRKFGKWRVVPSAEVSDELFNLGPDPLTPGFTWEHFKAALARTNRAVKAAILDQGVLAGVGNIYADEALFRARIRPEKLASALSVPALKRLYEAIPFVLRQGIEYGGTTLSDYVDADGKAGSHQELLQVYGRYGEPCLVCGTTLRRTAVAQRTSSWCPRCQK